MTVRISPVPNSRTSAFKNNCQIVLFTATVDGPCSLPKKPGPCRGFCPRYYYESNTDSCHEFTYGCCGGNANNFKTNALCENACKQFRGESNITIFFLRN